MNGFLPINFKIVCFVCSKEPSHRDGSIEYPQHMFSLRYKKNHFQLHTLTWSSEINVELFINFFLYVAFFLNNHIMYH